MLSRFITLCALILSAFAPSAHAAGSPVAAPAGLSPVLTIEGVSEYRLRNGMQVLLFPDASKATTTVNVIYRVGSRFEDYGETGMAHLLEHLMFKGSRRHANVPDEMSQRGAESNATTSYDHTHYFETFPASDDNLNWALAMEADRMVNSFIAARDLKTEMTVVRNEFESGENNPGNILVQRISSTAYLFHAYGRATIGARSDIENVSIARLQAFYRKYYQPDNAVLLVTGGFRPDTALRAIQRTFGAIPRPQRTLVSPYTVEPTQDGERTVLLRRAGKVQLAAAAYHVPAAGHPDMPALDLLTQILGDDTPAGRLHQALVQTQAASRVFGFTNILHDPSLMLLGAEVPPEGDLEKVRGILDKAVEGLAQQPVAAAELERVRSSQLSAVEMVLNDSDRLGSMLAQFVGSGDWRLFFLYRDRLAKVTLEDVQRVAATYLKPSNRTAGLFLPTSEPDRAVVPPSPDLGTMLGGYRGGAGIAAGEAFEPTPRNIESRVQRRTLANGGRIALLSKRTRGATVNADLTLRFGDAESLTGKASLAQLTAAMLARGTLHRGRQDIQDELDRLRSRINISGSGDVVTAHIESTRDRLPEVLKLAVEILREPAFPAAELAELKQARITELEHQKTEPEAVAGLALRQQLTRYPPEDVRAVVPPDVRIARVQAVDVEAVKAFHRDFYGASDARVAVVGDFDESGTGQLLEMLLGGWASPRPYRRLESMYWDVPGGDLHFETPDKANAVLLAGMNLPMRDDDADYPALELANYVFGGGFLNSRLATRVRQREGLSYSVGTDFSASARDRSGTFTAYAICAPSNAARVEAALRDEMKRVATQGFQAREVASAKAGLLQSLRVGRAQDASLAVQLSDYLDTGRTFAWDADMERRLGTVSPDRATAVFRRYLDPSRLTVVKAGDFAARKQ